MGARGREYFLANYKSTLLLDRLERLITELVEEKKVCAS